jgi:hypothetical protein
MSESQQEVLARILKSLRSEDSTDQLAAIHELSRLNYSSPAIVLELENLAVKGTKPIRQATLDALDLRISQYVRTKTMKHLSPDECRAILAEIKDWEDRELIQHEAAEVLVRRYDFHRMPIELAKPVVPAPETIEPPAPQPVTPAVLKPAPAQMITPPPITVKPEPAEPAASRLTLSQRLLSQTSINIALYLGAFLVIGAAVILAYLVEATRLPILLSVTVLFAGGSIAIKKRLPQPSFILFVVFSFLLPINAIVIAQNLNLYSQDANAYWSAVFFFMALIWGFSTWLYSSRLFSIASFVAFSIAVLRFGSIFNAPTEWNIFSLMVASLIGLLGVHLLKGWKDSKFALPLFIAAQIVNGFTLLGSLVFATNSLFNQDASASIWIATSLTWIAVASFYAWSGLLFTFPFFAWGAVASLLPASWLILKSFNAPAVTQIIGLWVWGVIFSFSSEFFARRAANKAKEYYLPFLFGTLPLFLISAFWAFLENTIHDVSITYAFGVLLGVAVIYTALMALRPRAYVWAAALIFGLAAYFTFFALPFIKLANVYAGYQMLGASLLLLAPELLFKSSFTFKNSWRWPVFILGAFITTINIVLVLVDQFSLNAIVIVMGIYTLLFAAYALHLRRPKIGYLATTAAAISTTYVIQHFNLNLDLWLAILTGLSVIYFICGYFLRSEKTKAWGTVLRISGLALGTIISFAALSITKEISGWYVLFVSAMFFAETYIRSEDRIEASGPFFASIASFLILRKFNITDLPFHLLALSLIWLGADLIYSRTLKQRRLAILTRLIGGGLAVGNLPASLIHGYQQGYGYANQAAIIFGVYVLFFAIDALLYQEPMIGYASTGFLAFAILLTLQYVHRDPWLPALTGLSVLYFVSGYFLHGEKSRGWGSMFRISGLAVGALMSFASLILLKNTGEWYILIVGALFVSETYLRREDRMEMSAPIFFSIAMFLGLYDFHVNEFPYYLLVISLIWLSVDLLYAKTFKTRRFAMITRVVGGAIACGNALALITSLAGNQPAAIGFGVYAIFFAIYAWFYRNPRLGYIATASLPLSVFFELQMLHQENWLYEMAVIAILYYAAGFVLRRGANAQGWSQMLLYSGLGLGVINSISAPLRIGLDAAIPVALAATLFAVEAFDRRNIWLGFPANILYFESYFLILTWLDVRQPQFFSVGAAALGMLMHYLLTRAGSKTGAFIMGSASQLVLLGTTYIQMVAELNLSFFFVLFFQSLAVLAYGIVMRSRSLVIAPISFTVLGVLTVIFYALKNLSLVVIIGATGIALLLLGILAAVMRERIATLVERFRDWQA